MNNEPKVNQYETSTKCKEYCVLSDNNFGYINECDDKGCIVTRIKTSLNSVIYKITGQINLDFKTEEHRFTIQEYPDFSALPSTEIPIYIIGHDPYDINYFIKRPRYMNITIQDNEYLTIQDKMDNGKDVKQTQ